MRTYITRVGMAHALSIVGEKGGGSFEYESAINAIRAGHIYRSKKCRWTLSKSPEFSVDEFKDYMMYAARASYIDAGNNTAKLARGEYGSNTCYIHLTLEGWRQIELYDQPLLHRWGANLRDNIPTVVISVVTALFVGWAISIWGPPK